MDGPRVIRRWGQVDDSRELRGGCGLMDDSTEYRVGSIELRGRGYVYGSTALKNGSTEIWGLELPD